MERSIPILFVLCMIFATPVYGNNGTVYHTMLYVKVANFTDLRTPAITNTSQGLSGTCCRKMPIENCTHLCETVFSICVGSCNSVLFNITYSHNTNRIYDKNYGVGHVETPSINNQNVTIKVTETRMNLQNGIQEHVPVTKITKRYSRSPFSSFWSGRYFTWQHKSNIMLTLEVHAFCESDWYSPQHGCSDNIPADDIHSVHFDMAKLKLLPQLDCRDEETSKMTFITDRPYKYTNSILEALLARFLADKVCSSITYNVSVDIRNVRYNSPYLRVIFKGGCVQRHVSLFSVAGAFLEISDLRILQALLFMSPYEERQYFIDPVLRTDLSNTRNQGRFQLLFRLKSFSNPSNIYFDHANAHYKMKNCPADGCSPVFYFSYYSTEKYFKAASTRGGHLSDCFGYLVNPQNTTEKTNDTILSQTNLPLVKTVPLRVEIVHQKKSYPIGFFNLDLDGQHVVGSSFAQARSRIITARNNNTNVSAEVEIMVWCSNGYYGPTCNDTCPDDDRDCNVAKCADHFHRTGAFHCRKGTCDNKGSCACPLGLAGTWCNIVNHYLLPFKEDYHFNQSDKLTSVQCDEGFYGFNCDEIDYCSNSSCNHGRCFNLTNSYYCYCDAGYAGHNCEVNIDDCRGITCFGKGKCQDLVSDYKCDCINGYSGKNCEFDVDDCTHVNCSNHGVCLDLMADYKCNCMNGYSGKDCEINIDDCTIVNCSNHGTCNDLVGYYKCDCMNGYSGKDCEINIDNCKNVNCSNHGTCSDLVADYKCNCMNGYSGKDCEINIDDCSKVTCNNHGTCSDLVADYKCYCMDGYSGKDCEINIDECSNVTCNNHGTCSDLVADYICNCMNGYSGKDCEINIDDCSNITCNNHGTCNDLVADFKCNCMNGYSGKDCEINIDDCSNITCNNHGTCSDLVADYKCNCMNGYSGKDCEINIDDCSNVTCNNHGTCSDLVADYKCNCMNGYSGKDCEINIDDCSNVTCNNHGTCSDLVADYKCNCMNGYSGKDCEINIDDCSNVTCNNHGTCSDLVADYKCNCMNGYSGKDCEINIDDCSNITCNNHGTCNDLVADFKCNCMNGYSGKDCEINIDECTNVNCSNHGTCNDLVADYKCNCMNGYSGKDCEINIDDCTNVNCDNNGTCNDLLAGYKCNCMNGYSGNDCEINIDECQNVNCSNHGTCVDHIANYTCICVVGYSGNNCEIDPTGSSNVSCNGQGLRLEDGINSRCTNSGWNITVNMTILECLYPDIATSNIHFGDNSCPGKVAGNLLMFQQGFGECLTSKRISGNTLIYVNDLFYAIYDPARPFIIRQYRWTYTVECDVNRNEVTSTHVHHDVDAHHTAITGRYNINMTFFNDVNFLNEVPGNPLHANIGDDIYVKVFTRAMDWTVKMRLHTCYTSPSDGADKSMLYYLIKDGCEVDDNTHIISQSTHETRFVFQDFGYSSNREGLNIYCNATFCETKDYSPGCAQSCGSPGTQALVGK